MSQLKVCPEAAEGSPNGVDLNGLRYHAATCADWGCNAQGCFLTFAPALMQRLAAVLKPNASFLKPNGYGNTGAIHVHATCRGNLDYSRWFQHASSIEVAAELDPKETIELGRSARSL